MKLSRRLLVMLTLLGLIAGCAPSTSPGSGRDGPDTARVSTPKRFTAAIRGNPHTVYQKLNPRGNIPGIDALELMVNTGLTVPSLDGSGLTARLAEAAPTIENGNWKVLPDGQMEIRWTIREGAVWHDGAPVTAEDMVFTAEVVRDRRLPVLNHVAYQSLGTVEAVNSRTVLSRWTRTYIKGNELFGPIGVPMPKHLLQEPYANLADQEQFVGIPYWSVDFVGTGPFKIKQWEAGSYLVFEANDRYIFGRPKIDEVTVKFIPDPNTLGANILSGEVDMNWGDRVDLEWAMNVSSQWQYGKLKTAYSSMVQIFAQHINSTPPIVGTSVDFKRAMVHALDRQTMVEVLQFGLTDVGHSFLSPRQPEWPAVESSIVKYEYDPRKSLQILEGLGYTRAADGALRDGSGQRLAFQIRTSQGDVTQEKAMYASADDWQKLGIEVERHFVVPQRASDAEYRATFPAFDVKRQAGTMEYATAFHTRGIALPENNFLVSGNNSRYSRPEMDNYVDKYFTTVPVNERMEWARQIVHKLSDEVGWIGLYHLVGPSLIPNRVVNWPTTEIESTALEFIHEWELK